MDARQILDSSYLDIIFDKRNKAYGGYELRKKYAKRTRNALLSVVSGAMLLTAIPVLADQFRPPAKATGVLPKFDTVYVSGLTEIQHEELVQPLPKAAPPPPAATIAAPSFVIADKPDPTLDEERPEHPQDRIPGAVTGDGVVDGTSPLAGGIPGGTGDDGTAIKGPAVADKPEASDEALMYIDRKASFNGDMYRWLALHLEYPESERQQGNSGKVIVQFVVELNGSLTAVTVSKTSGYPALDAEAVRVIRRMPAWTPGLDKNKPVRSIYKQPVTFRLD